MNRKGRGDETCVQDLVPECYDAGGGPFAGGGDLCMVHIEPCGRDEYGYGAHR